MDGVMSDKPRKATLLQVIRMVFSAFIGIRKRGEHEKIEVTPVQVIIVGIIAGAAFVGTIVSVVQFITR
jgi:tetraacyldisaccharide-1-P 4'-kinase